MRGPIQRGQVYWADLGSGSGSEQRGQRPALIIQNDVGNLHSTTVIVAAITDGAKRYMPTHVYLETSHGLSKNSVVLLEQVRTIDKARLGDKMADLSQAEMCKVDVALHISLGLTTGEGSR
ncbi:type II toxin-antitoxin system PemK/MazF family toxin [Paenibacillus sp. FSL H7-0756]|uniref:type II toxin-antitoxin system PemK/MazF family toxin n=1 Tax=Paenibacillus sp. FSL H7-0756 TaxID=2954738 RepID=UPI0030F66DC6